MESVVPSDNIVGRRANKAMNRLKAVHGVHEKAMDAVLNLVNPFPDYPVERVGWPDAKSGASLVLVDLWEQIVKQPTGLSEGETWDCHVAMNPQCFSGKGYSCGINNDGSFTEAATFGNNDAVVVSTGPTGQILPAISWSSAQDAFIRHRYDYGPLAEGQPFRVVAQGLEIVNTSAMLYKGGASFAYRYSTPKGTWARDVTPSANFSQSFDVTGITPQQPSQIVNYPNTYVGDAKDGLYVINTPVEKENPVLTHAGKGIYYAQTAGAIATSGVAVRAGSHNGMCNAGGFMMGLAQGTSLLVKHRVYLEIFPGIFNTAGTPEVSFSRLTNLSTPYSPMIMEVLSQVLREMPAGCPYTENPLGEWFESLLEKIEQFAPVVGSALGTVFPAANIIGQVASKAAKIVREGVSDVRALPSKPSNEVSKLTRNR